MTFLRPELKIQALQPKPSSYINFRVQHFSSFVMSMINMHSCVSLSSSEDLESSVCGELSSLLYSEEKDLVFLCPGAGEVEASLQLMLYLSSTVRTLLAPALSHRTASLMQGKV